MNEKEKKLWETLNSIQEHPFPKSPTETRPDIIMIRDDLNVLNSTFVPFK